MLREARNYADQKAGMVPEEIHERLAGLAWYTGWGGGVHFAAICVSAPWEFVEGKWRFFGIGKNSHPGSEHSGPSARSPESAS